MRILALSSWWPEPADNGARLRLANLLRAVASHHEVHLAALTQEPITREQSLTVEQMCASVVTVPQKVWLNQRLDLLSALWHREPAYFRGIYNPAFAQVVQERATAIRPELIIAFQVAAAPYARMIPNVPRVLDEVEVTRLYDAYVHAATARRRARAGLTWWKHRCYLRDLLRDFDACTVVSTLEQDRVQPLAGPGMPVVVVPNGASLARAAGSWDEPQSDTLVYPASLSYDANYDAAAYFLQAIFPSVRQERPQVRLTITGRSEPAQREALGCEGVDWSGYVQDIRPVIARAWCEVVPLRIGGGTRLKVLEALALGTPVVSTSKGVEGLALENDCHVLIADGPREFARATLRLLSDPGLRARLARDGLKVVADRYDWEVIGQQLNRLVEETDRRHVL